MKKILVTGGAGYIGSHTIVEILSRTDWNPISIDNFHNSSAKTYERIASITGKKIAHHNIDLRNLHKLRKVFSKRNIKGIIHFAAMKSVPESVDKPLGYYDNNINSLLNVLKCQKEFNVPSMIFSSSCSVYGTTEDLPVSELTPLGKTECPYAFTKVIGENMLSDLAAIESKLNFIALRYFNPVGAHESGKLGELPNGVPNNLVPFITQTAAGLREELTVFGSDYDTVDGTCVRDYIHVSDIAGAHVKALNHLFSGKSKKNYDVFNLGTGKGVSVMQAIKAFEKSAKVDLNYKLGERRAGDIAQIYADTKKSSEVLGWKAEKSIDSMMESAWKWQKNITD